MEKHNREANLELIELASSEATMTKEEEFAFYMDRGLRSKASLLEEIKDCKERFKNPSGEKKSDAYYERLMMLIDRFYEDVSSMFLMEELNDWWGYGFQIRETGITLLLEHFVVMYDRGVNDAGKLEERHNLVSDESFNIHQTKANLLTLEEYGNIYEVAADTVRQWIRRGKIRSAVKLGSEWRIPDIAEVSGRKYTPGHYTWDGYLPDAPDVIPDINMFDEVSIQPGKATGEWCAMLHDKKHQNSGRAMTTKMKEKLELYLISQPEVECINNYLGEVHQRGGIDHE